MSQQLAPPDVTVITGAGGWLGTGLVAAFLSDDHEYQRAGRLRLLVRDPADAVVLRAASDRVEVVIGDMVPHRLVRARELGADLAVDVSKDSMADAVRDVTGKGAHVIFDCAGKTESINAALESVRTGGRIVIIGIPSQAETPIRLWSGLHQEVTIKVQKRNNGNDHDALKLIETGKIDPASILSHSFPLAQGNKGFEMMGAYSDGVIKPWIEI